MINTDTNAVLNFEEDSNEDGRDNPANEWKLVVSKKKLPNNHGNAKFKKPQRKSYTNIAHREAYIEEQLSKEIEPNYDPIDAAKISYPIAIIKGKLPEEKRMRLDKNGVPCGKVEVTPFVEDFWLPYKKQIRLDKNVDIAIIHYPFKYNGQRYTKICFQLNNLYDEPVLNNGSGYLYQQLTKRNKQVNLFESQNDSSKVKMTYVAPSELDEFIKELRQISPNHRAERLVRKTVRPTTEEIEKVVCDASLHCVRKLLAEYIKSTGRKDIKFVAYNTYKHNENEILEELEKSGQINF
jgi:hypothetical protein